MSIENFDVRISSLEAVIAGYESGQNNATTPEEKSEYRKLIITGRENLTELLKEKRSLSQSQEGRYLLSPTMFLHCFLRYSCLLYYDYHSYYCIL
jgi:hypothetical protein